tara:strand:- start:1331 stop:1489 length:159 start_codon:yes stop_codon:yes gene_type:complete
MENFKSFWIVLLKNSQQIHDYGADCETSFIFNSARKTDKQKKDPGYAKMLWP